MLYCQHNIDDNLSCAELEPLCQNNQPLILSKGRWILILQRRAVSLPCYSLTFPYLKIHFYSFSGVYDGLETTLSSRQIEASSMLLSMINDCLLKLATLASSLLSWMAKNK